MNLLLITADQFRHDCMGWTGTTPAQTPHLDSLARQGVRFTHAFAPLPVCSPARQALLTGRHPDSFGAQWNYDFIKTPPPDPDICWTTPLPDLGWNTGYIGRFHISEQQTSRDFGYQDFVPIAQRERELQQQYPNVQWTGGWLGCTSPIPYQEAAPHWQAAQAKSLIDRYAREGKPWHLWVDFKEPHLPVRPSEPFASMFDPEKLMPWAGSDDDFYHKPYAHRQQTVSWQTEGFAWKDFAPMVARYLGLIAQLDDAIGNILHALDQLGQRDDTMVVFTADHGDMCGSHRMLDKHYVMYDDIIRVPLLVRKPGTQPHLSDAFVSNVLDVAATFRADSVQERDPEGHGLPLPLAMEGNGRNDIVCSSNGQQFGLYTTRCLRDRTHKYVWNLTDVDELYDLEHDPGELVNRIDDPDEAGRVATMRRTLLTRLAQHNDPFVKSEWTKRQLISGHKHVPWQ
ncbi:MAG: sulfatase-like hydrolase/transferase [Clostridiales bacterium]|nr:sulfatase-like hydrolase/transferase [Clostridiales bacterium]